MKTPKLTDSQKRKHYFVEALTILIKHLPPTYVDLIVERWKLKFAKHGFSTIDRLQDQLEIIEWGILLERHTRRS